MKHAFVLLLFALYFTMAAYGQAEPNIFDAGNAFDIKGKITHYIPTDNNGFVTVRTYAVTGVSKDTSLPVDHSGNFNAKLSQPFASDIALMYKDGYVTLYAGAKENIGITIDDALWDSADNKLDALQITGSSAAISKTIIDFDYHLLQHTFNNKPNLGDKDQSDSQFAAVSSAYAKESLAFLHDYIVTKHIDNPFFQQWCSNNIIYKAANDITFRCFAGKINKTILHKQLVQYLSLLPVLKQPALNNSDYYNFVRSIAIDFEIIVNVNDSFKDAVKQNGNIQMPFYLQQANRYTTGITKQLMYYDIYTTNLKRLGNYSIDSFYTVVKQPYLQQLMLVSSTTSNTDFKPYNLVEGIQRYKADDSLKARLLNLFDKQKGAFTYIDFWGNWCGPCMMEMPTYKAFIQKFAGKNIQFVFLAVDMPAEKVDEIKTKYNIPGKFILLTGNETKIMNNVLQFSSYPSHFVVNPTGLVIDNTISHIGANGEVSDVAVNKLKELLGH